MSRFHTPFIYMIAGAILAAGLMFILRPAPSVSQIDQSMQGTLNAIMSKLASMDRKLDGINGRLGAVSTEVSRIYTRTGGSLDRPSTGHWAR